MRPLHTIDTHKSLVLGEICDINFEGLTFFVNSRNLSYKNCSKIDFPLGINR